MKARKIIDREKVEEARRQTRERKAAEEAEQTAHMKEYRATIKKGYTPDKETILAQIEALYADGKISIQEYNWGMAGLDLVHGHVEAAQAEQDDLPF